MTGMKSDKGDVMNQDLTKQFCPEEVKAVTEEKCPLCKKEVKVEDFKDSLSQKEFIISGLCQSCQDGYFEEEEEA
jgi:hypothetical protein